MFLHTRVKLSSFSDSETNELYCIPCRSPIRRTLAFTIGFSTFLLLFVNWTEVLKCQNADSCASVKPLRPDALLHASFGDVIVFLYFLIFSLYWVWNLFSSLYAIRDGWEMRAFFQDQLSISEERLATMEWSAVVDTIVALQRTLRLCVVKDLNALDIANRIMRSENYMIALVNKRLLDLRIPWTEILRAPFTCCCCRSSTSSVSEDESPSDRSKTAADALAAVRRLEANADEDPADQDEKDDEADSGGWCRSLLPRRVVLTRLLDWNVRFCVLNSMFDQEFVVRPAFLTVCVRCILLPRRATSFDPLIVFAELLFDFRFKLLPTLSHAGHCGSPSTLSLHGGRQLYLDAIHSHLYRHLLFPATRARVS